MSLEYICAVKRGLRDRYHFAPIVGSGDYDPIFADGQVPDGRYPMMINGRLDHVEIRAGKIHCCRFDEVNA